MKGFFPQILPMYPTIELRGKWRLIEDSGEDFICFIVGIKISP
jgi:hypothetical protein